ncbi:MAG TPA: hypothetical protein VGQ96_04500, partial [Candidatus Eremiobacteraceae bacterium]|nr:hypothetical protein [Candidatus Eremiobacteraceae bacterium]
MQSPYPALVVFACAFVAASAVLVRGASGAPSHELVSGIFVSYDVNQRGGSITIQEADRLMVYSLAASPSVRERSAAVDWQTISLAQIAQGEPVSLQLDGAGLVRAVEAEFSTVTTRLVTQRNGFVVTTSGQAYKLVGGAAQVQPAWSLGTYLRMRVDPKSMTAFDIAASSQPFSG